MHYRLVELFYRLLGRHSVDALLDKHSKVIDHLRDLADRQKGNAARHSYAAACHDKACRESRAHAERAERIAGKFAELIS